MQSQSPGIDGVWEWLRQQAVDLDVLRQMCVGSGVAFRASSQLA